MGARSAANASGRRGLISVRSKTPLSVAAEGIDASKTIERDEPMNRWAGFRSVLCAVDFSEHSRQALRYAEVIALRGHASLRVLYVNDPLLIAAAAALRDRTLATRSAHELRTLVEATVAGTLRGQRRLTTSVAVGDPADEILKASAKSRTDLIVLGTHGLTGAQRMLMGSTTLSVLQRTSVPVLAVPHSAESTRDAVSESWPGDRIVAAAELDSRLPDQVDTAARIADWLNTSLLLIHVVAAIARPAWLTTDLSAHDRIRLAHAQRQLDAVAVRAQRYVKTATRVVCGTIADEITAVAATERSGLVLTALRDRRGWFGATRGSISYHVLSHAITPVLAHPLSWRPR
jgi:universal stress protein A